MYCKATGDLCTIQVQCTVCTVKSGILCTVQVQLHNTGKNTVCIVQVLVQCVLYMYRVCCTGTVCCLKLQVQFTV